MSDDLRPVGNRLDSLVTGLDWHGIVITAMSVRSLDAQHDPAEVPGPLGLPRGLFWEYSDERLPDPDEHAGMIICRVVELGGLEDWRRVREHYGEDAMKLAVRGARDLSPQAVALCRAAFNLAKEDFRCCTSRPFPRAPSSWSGH